MDGAQTESLQDLHRALAAAGTSRDWPAMIATAQRIRAAYPHSEDADYYEARGLIEGGHYEAADHILLLGMDRFPRNPALAVLYGECGTRGMLAEDAIARWQSLERRLPDVPNIHMGLAHAYSTASRSFEAERTLAAALQRLPDNVELLVARAQMGWEQQDWHAVLRDWSEVHRLAPDRPDPVVFMVRALANMGQCGEADTLAIEYMGRQPGNVPLAVSYAMVADAAGNAPDAGQRWRRVLALAPGHLFAPIGLSRALRQQNRVLEAIAALQEGLRHHPANDVLLKEIEAISDASERPEDAVAAWKATYEQQPASAEIYLKYAEALIKADKLADAADIVSEGVGFAPDNRKLRIRHASLAARMGDHKEAMRRWREVDRMFPDHPAVQKGMRNSERALQLEAERIETENRMDGEKGKSSLLPPPIRPPRDTPPPPGPTALDLLLTGAPAGHMAIKPTVPTGFAALTARLRRALGKD